jgi:hypothetical protein
VPALAKNARTGHPQSWNGKEEPGKPGHPSTEVNALFLRRVGVVAAELVAEALLLGLLLAVLLVPTNIDALAVGSFPVVLVLFLHGYYFTRPVLGLVWSGVKRPVYGLLASVLFIVHMGIGYARLKPDMRQVRTGTVLTFFAAGAVIVFACAVIGHGWLMQKRGMGSAKHSADV